MEIRRAHRDTDERFERAFAEAKAKAIIVSMSGFGSLALRRCIEQPSRYLLLVYDPFPVVEHHESLVQADRVPRNAGWRTATESRRRTSD